MHKCASALLLFAVTLMAPSAMAERYGSGWYGQFEVAGGYEDNVAKSYTDADDTGDSWTAAAAGLGYSRKLGTTAELLVNGYVRQRWHDEYDDLDRLALSLGSTLVWQPRPHYDAPWYHFSGDVVRFTYENSDAREGYLVTLGGGIHRRFGGRTIGRFGYRYLDLIFDKSDEEERRDAAFDVARHELFAGLDVRLAGELWLAADYAFQHGGFTSSSSASPGEFDYDALTEDPVFESCNVIRCVPYYAFRNVTDVHSLALALVFPLQQLDVDFSGRYIHAESENGLDYDDWLVQVGASWTF